MNAIIKWFAKKYILAFVNDVIQKSLEKDGVKAALAKVDLVDAYLHLLKRSVADGKITDEEADDLIAKFSKLVDELKK